MTHPNAAPPEPSPTPATAIATPPASPMPRRIADALRGPAPCFSFEFFPPRTPAQARALSGAIADLAPLAPTFVSVTDGAGGSTRSLTREVVTRLQTETGLTAAAHLTCAGHSRADLRDALAALRDAGVVNVLALRGDPPRGEAAFTPALGGLAHADELVRLIRTEGFDFCVGAACYPEGHLESPDRAADIARLAHKVAAGVDFLITQLFFDPAHYFDFVTRARAAGITVPIVPGVMPVTDTAQIQRFTRLCGATLPMRLLLALERCDTAEETRAVGVAWATEQCRELLARGAPGIHFYTLNRSPATRLILQALRA